MSLTPVEDLKRWLPKGWAWTKAKYVATLGTGHTPDRHRRDYWVDCDIPWVTAADLSSRPSAFEPLLDTEQKVSALGVANSAAVVHPAGTVMFCRTASVGLFCITGRPMATTQAFATWTPGPDLDGRFLLYAVAALGPEFERLAYGSTHLTIYMPDLEAIQIPLPPLVVQRRVADFLDDQVSRIDSIIEARREQMALCRDSHAAEVAEDLGHVSERVESRPLRRFLRAIQTGGTPSSEMAGDPAGIPWYTPASIDGQGHLLDPVRWLPRDAARREGVAVFPTGSVILVGIGATAGRVTMLDHTATGNQQLTALTPAPGVSSRFLFHQLQTRASQLLESAPFTTLPILNNETVKAFAVVVPPYLDQESLSQKWDASQERHERLVALARQQVTHFQELKRSLITAAVSGEFDVSAADGSGVAV